MSGDLDQSSLSFSPEPETNVYSFGVLMLEIISGKLSDSDEEGSIIKWVKLIPKTKSIFLKLYTTNVTLVCFLNRHQSIWIMIIWEI